MTAEITQRGQITIPKSVRQKYGLDIGAEVDLVDLNGTIMIVPKEATESVNRLHANFDRMREELVAANVGIDDMMAALKKVRAERG